MTTIPLDEDLLEELNSFDPTQPEEDDPDELSPEFVSDLIDKCLQFNEVLVGHPLHEYQIPLARRIIESVLINDGEEITALAARQSGKTETVADVVATLMILLPRLGKIYPDLLGRFKEGLWVGMFAPVEGQVETMFSRAVTRLTSERAREIMGDPEINDKPTRGGSSVKTVRLARSGSYVSMMTANPRAKIESRTFHLIIIDECFPAETPVLTTEGWVPIGEIVTGDRRDWIVATQDADGLGWGHVRTGYRTPRHTDLVRVDHEYGSVYATANHPFMVGGEAISAISLTPGSMLSVVPRSDQPRSNGIRQAVRPTVLFESVQGQISQPDGERRDTGVDVLDPPTNWAPSQSTGREWPWIDQTTADTLGRFTHRMGGRACLPYWRANQGRPPYALQDRRSESNSDGRCGDRRSFTHNQDTSGIGSAEGPVAVQSRVVGVQVLQPGSFEFDQFSDRADYVYTLEVESESHTYIAGGVLVGNCQDADDRVVAKSISPMLAYYAGSMVKTGTPTTHKNNFYRSIQLNKRRQTAKRGARQNHFEWDWREVAKVNPNYEKFIRKEMLRIGEDSDEFNMSYGAKWILERGMFTSQKVMDELGDTSMNIVRSWFKTPVVVGVDPARKTDSTVVTVVWVDWDRPDEYGYYDHRVLNWLELQGDDWEEQYARIVDFLSHYNVLAVSVDANGVGDAVAQRLRLLLPRAEVHSITSSQLEQSKRFKHLLALMERRMVGWPAHANVRRTRIWRKFQQQMLDAERIYKGQYFTVRAPDEAWAHDDFVDSLSLAVANTAELQMPNIEVSNSPFFG